MIKRIVPLLCIIVILLSQTGCNNLSEQKNEYNKTVEDSAECSEVDKSESQNQVGSDDTYDEMPGAENLENLDDSEMVRVKTYISDISVDLKYATTDNFTGVVIYDFSEAYLRAGTVKKLNEVQKELKDMGLSLKIWDAYRPVSAQKKLWSVCPDPTYVANPNTGFSSHSRGNTVDVTLVYLSGEKVQMPTGFDDFSALADRDYSDCDETSGKNAELLEKIMVKYGFKPYYGEWWHFSDQTEYEVEEELELKNLG